MVFRVWLRSVITVCPKAKICFAQSQQCIMNMKIFNSTLGIIFEIWCKWLMFSEFSNNALTWIFGNVLNISQDKNIDYIPKLMVLFNVLF